MIEMPFFSQLEKYYKKYLTDIVIGKPFEPIVLRGGKNRPETTAQLHQHIQALQKHEKTNSAKGWRIEWVGWTSKKLGKQKWPESILVDSEEDYLSLIKKEKEVLQFKNLLTQLVSWRAEIRDFLISQPLCVLQFQNSWNGICSVIDYLSTNNVRHHYIRSIPVPVHTKFISEHKSIILSMLRRLVPDILVAESNNLEEALGLKTKFHLYPLRWLDRDLADKYMNGIEYSAVTLETLKDVKWEVDEIWMFENETNLYLMPQRKNALGIFSKGYATHTLANIPFFKKSKIIYWGDLDEDGFIMLQIMRSYYPHLRSAFMDKATIDFHLSEIDKQPAKYRTQKLELINPSEVAAFEKLLELNGRLEQEKLSQEFIQTYISKTAE